MGVTAGALPCPINRPEMTQREFVIVFVALPLTIALGWLLWRARYFLRNLMLYALVVGALLAVVRLGHMGWTSWTAWSPSAATTPQYPVCISLRVRMTPDSRDSCWT